MPAKTKNSSISNIEKMLPWKIIQVKVMCGKFHALVIYQPNWYIFRHT